MSDDETKVETKKRGRSDKADKEVSTSFLIVIIS